MLERWNCGKGPNGFGGRKSGHGRPLGECQKKFGQKTADIDWDFENFLKNTLKNRSILSQSYSDREENLTTDSPCSPQQYWRPRATRTGNLGTRYELTKLKKWKNRHSGRRFLAKSHHIVKPEKICLLHLFISTQLGATCQISGKSVGRFRRSCKIRAFCSRILPSG